MDSDNKFGKENITLQNDTFLLKYDVGRGGFVSLQNKEDRYGTEYLIDPAEFPEMDIRDARWFGHIVTRYRIGEEDWRHGNSAASADVRAVQSDGRRIQVSYRGDASHADGIRYFDLDMSYRLEADGLYWDMKLTNRSDRPITFDSIGIPLLFNQIFRGDSTYKYEQNVMRHSLIAGEGSYIYWARTGDLAPFLVMMPGDKTGFAAIEKERKPNSKQNSGSGSPFGRHSSFNDSWEGLVTVIIEGSSGLVLAPGGSARYGFKLAWAHGVADIGRLAYENGQVDVEVLPGLVVPRDDRAVVVLRCKKEIHSLTASCPDQTDIRYEGERAGGYRIYSIAFMNDGEQTVTIHYGDGERMALSFFSMGKLDELIDRHAAFIADNHFETNPDDPCYHGLLMWDMTLKSRINATCNPYRDDWWAGGSDEIGLVSGLFLSEKNVYRPEEAQLKVLDLYLSDFVEERLTEQPGYRVHRMVPWFQMFEPWAGHGADDVWRAFNYVHVVNTYFNMYRIQRLCGYPYLKPAAHYLGQAYQYTKAMFTYWMFPEGVGATEYGNMGELTIPLDLADALALEGMAAEAEWVKETAAAKAAFFGKAAYPFGSEMAYDSTAYEAVYAYAKGAGDRTTMKKAAMASFANRGHQPQWQYYNTDLRQHGETHWNVSYMTQLGGWVLYDYALNEGDREYELVKSAYASYLAGWSLINLGYWDRDPANEGASCWILHMGEEDSKERKAGRVPLIKKAWQMSGESGLGYFAGLKMAASIIVDHPVLGMYGFGCDVEANGSIWTIRPRDGLRMRVYDTVNNWSIQVDQGAIRELEVDLSAKTIRAHVDNAGHGPYEPKLYLKSDRNWRLVSG